MTAFMTVSAGDTFTNVPASTRVTGRESLSSDQRPSIAVPESQLYYWSRAWQENERIAAEEIKRGDVHRFSDPTAAVRWLLACEE